MPLQGFTRFLDTEIDALQNAGTAKGAETVVTEVLPPSTSRGARFRLAGEGGQEFIRMNSNSYLGLAFHQEVLQAEEKSAHAFGVGPGAVRFISGTYKPHVELEKELAAFHGREACMITSAAYTSVMGVVSSLTTPQSVIISDELNHNCIINAMKLARPQEKKVFGHLDMAALEALLAGYRGKTDHILLITDGVFSMRGDYAPLDEMVALVEKYDGDYERNIVLIVDDSHGAGAYGPTGRGTEELTGVAGKVDILVATLGKAFGVNGGYLVTRQSVVTYLREKNPFYIYTNPITPSEAAAALRSVQILQSEAGQKLLSHLGAMTSRFENGLTGLGFETIPSPHPVVPLLTRDTALTSEMVAHLRSGGILATGLNYPVVPKGEQLIRFQVSADHTEADIDFVLDWLSKFPGRQ